MQSRWVKKGKVLGPFGPFSTAFIILFLLFASVVSASNIWYQTSLKPKGGGAEKIFVVRKGETAGDIAKRLEDEGLIKNTFAFRIYLFTSKIDNKIEAGSFRLNPNQSVEEIAKTLQHGRLDKWVTLVEGLRVEELASKLKEEFDIGEKKFIRLAKEGYMFPDTYLISTDADEERIVKILRENFDKKVDNEIRSQSQKEGLNPLQLITLASIVERESRSNKERPIIAGILLKRLKSGARLEVDATIQYALGYQKDEKTWWKKTLTEEDLNIDSPYNTRKVAGLPPGPICNPGLAAIKATALPKDSPYYYYLHDKSGKVYYAKTLEEHNANIAKYLK